MGSIKAIAKGAGVLRPYLKAVRRADQAAQDGGVIVVLDGEPTATATLRGMLGVDADQSLRDGDGLLVYATTEGHDPTLAAAVLAGAKREGRRVLSIVVGAPEIRAAIQQELLQVRPLEASNIAQVASLSNAGPVLAAIARTLDDEAVAAGKRYPALRPAVADLLISRAARQTGTIGIAAVVPGADMPAMTLIQVRLVAQLAALHGRPLDRRRGVEVAGVLASAFGWRAVARRAVGVIPIAGFALRGGVAYSATRTVGEAARAHFAKPEGAATDPLEGLQSSLKRVLSRRSDS
jgi:uncharacterized protein (DUF697 family)